jgi:hypothetical protein
MRAISPAFLLARCMQVLTSGAVEVAFLVGIARHHRSTHLDCTIQPAELARLRIGGDHRGRRAMDAISSRMRCPTMAAASHSLPL